MLREDDRVMFRMLSHKRRHLRAIAGALLLLSLFAMVPLTRDISANGGDGDSTVAATVSVGIQDLEASLTAQGTVSAGQTFVIQVALTNKGTTIFEDVNATIIVPEGIEIIRCAWKLHNYGDRHCRGRGWWDS